MTLRVLHLIAGLPTGGAEMMLYKLLSRTRHESLVVSMTDRGPMAARIDALGVPVHALGMRRGVPSPAGVLRLRKLIADFEPDVLQTWMYHADLLGGVTARLSGGIPVVWNVRQSTLDFDSSRAATRLTFRLAARLSRWLPERIVCCSAAGEELHVEFGYPRERIVLIPNGFDLAQFQPDEQARQDVRRELRLDGDVELIGLVARFDPQKDHRGFVHAAGRLLAARPATHFVLCGGGVERANAELSGWIAETGHAENFHLLGRREDVARITAALDLATSSSYQEGFPNVIGEAMACEVPCVVTDVGDSAAIVGGHGRVVPSRDPAALAAAWAELLDLPAEERRAMGRRARAHVREHFSLDAVAQEYDTLYETLAKQAS